MKCLFALVLEMRLLNAQDDRISREQAAKLKNPIPNTKKTIAEGRNLFLRNCTSCHGQDGTATVDAVGSYAGKLAAREPAGAESSLRLSAVIYNNDSWGM